MTSNRAVSHAVGFVLVFSIIIASVGIVTTAGYDQLNEFRIDEQQQNAERAMTLLQQNAGEIQRGMSVRRSGEIDLIQGSLATIGTSTSRIQVNITDRTGPEVDFEGEYALSGARYRVGDTEIALEGGALLRSDPSGTSMAKSPPIRCTDDRALVSVVTFRNRSFNQVSGGTVTVQFAENRSVVRFPRNRTGVNSTEGRADVTVRIHSGFQNGWERYLSSDASGFEPTGVDGEFECKNVDRYTVVQSTIDLAFVR